YTYHPARPPRQLQYVDADDLALPEGDAESERTAHESSRAREGEDVQGEAGKRERQTAAEDRDGGQGTRLDEASYSSLDEQSDTADRETESRADKQQETKTQRTSDDL